MGDGRPPVHRGDQLRRHPDRQNRALRDETRSMAACSVGTRHAAGESFGCRTTHGSGKVDDVSAPLVDELTIPAPSEAELADVVWQAQAEAFIRQARLDGRAVTLTATGKTYSPAQVGRLTETSKATIQRRIDDGTIMAHRVGSRWLIPEAEVDKYRQVLMAGIASSAVDEPWDE